MKRLGGAFWPRLLQLCEADARASLGVALPLRQLGEAPQRSAGLDGVFERALAGDDGIGQAAGAGDQWAMISPWPCAREPP